MVHRPWWMVPLALALVWLASLTPAHRHASQALFDAQLRLVWPDTPRRDVAVVDIDEASVRALQAQLGKWPYRHDAYALLSEFLLELGAKVVVLDLPLAGPREGDAQLAGTLRQSPRVVIAAAALTDDSAAATALPSGRVWPAHWPRTVWPALAAPSPALLAAQASPPAVTAPPAPGDGPLQRWALLHEVQGRGLSALPLAVLQAMDPATPLRYEGDRLRLGAQRWTLDAQGRVQMRLPARESIATTSWLRVGAAALGLTHDPALRARFAGRVVFVGSSALAAEPRRTALPDTAAWAALTSELAAGRTVGAPSRALDAALLALGALPLLTLRRRRADNVRTEGLLAAAAMLAVLMTSTLALAVSGTPSRPLAALALGAAGWLLASALRSRTDAALQRAGDAAARSGART